VPATFVVREKTFVDANWGFKVHSLVGRIPANSGISVAVSAPIAILATDCGYRLSASVWLPRPIEEVFAFFADPGNLNRLTPAWLNFRILTPPPITMRQGLRLDYRLRLRGLPITWQSEISVWDPPNRFVDEQRKGPYRRWVHRHRFVSTAIGTDVIDEVDYAVPGGRVAHRLFVKNDLLSIFQYRQRKLLELFGRTN
jgi:ligand-binding SRPBCC domain-containing protein